MGAQLRRNIHYAYGGLLKYFDFFFCFNYTWFERKQPQKTQAVVAPVRM